MIALELYRKYLQNSSLGLCKADKVKKLNYEWERLHEIKAGLAQLFQDDKSITDKKDHTIYTLIKKDILSSVLASANSAETVNTYQFFINSVINEIQEMKERAIA